MRLIIITLHKAAVLPFMWIFNIINNLTKSPVILTDFLIAWLITIFAQTVLWWLLSWPITLSMFSFDLIFSPDSADLWYRREMIFDGGLEIIINLTSTFFVVEFLIVPSYLSKILHVNQKRAFELARGSEEEMDFVRTQPPSYDPWDHHAFNRWKERDNAPASG